MTKKFMIQYECYDGAPLVGVTAAAIRVTEGSDHGQGHLEDIQRTLDNVQFCFARLLDVLVSNGMSAEDLSRVLKKEVHQVVEVDDD